MSDKVCNICTKEFCSSAVCNRHLRSIHGISIDYTRGQWCSHPDCGGYSTRYTSIDKYRAHLGIDHNIRDIMKCVEFRCATFEEFLQWKIVQEKLDKSNFVSNTGAKKTKQGIRQVYECNRSGSYLSQGTGQRKQKSQGSRKTGVCCPAAIVVDQLQDCWSVKYYPAHYGHQNDLEHLSLSAADKLEIASQLARGITPRQIVHSMVTPHSDNIGRHHLVTRKDVANISRSSAIFRHVMPDSSSFMSDPEKSLQITTPVLDESPELCSVESTKLKCQKNLSHNVIKRHLVELESLRKYTVEDDPLTKSAIRHLVHAKRLLNLNKCKFGRKCFANNRVVNKRVAARKRKERGRNINMDMN